MPQDVVTTEPNQLIKMAIDKDLDVEKLSKLLEMKEAWDKQEAKREYNRAMLAFKSNPPEILKTKKVTYQNVNYSHAELDKATEIVGKALAEHKLYASWQTEQNGQVEVTCTITHEMGHSESTTLKADADKSGSKNSIQAIGSTVTYLQRYTLFAITGLAAKGQDDDGRAAEPEETITKEQANKIGVALADMGKSEPLFCKVMGVGEIKDIPASKYEDATKLLNSMGKQ